MTGSTKPEPNCRHENEHLIDDAIRALEAVEWSGVDTVSSETAAVFTSRLIEARADR